MIARLLVTVLALAGAMRSDDPIQIKRSPKAGVIVRYKESSKFSVGDDDRPIEITVIKKAKVLSAVQDRYVEETVVLPNDDDTHPFDGMTTTRTYLLDGSLVETKSKSDDPHPDRRGANQALVLLPDSPVKKGDKWERTFKATGSDAFETKCTFTYQGTEEIDGTNCAIVEFEQKETTGCICSGRAWLDLADGALVKKTFKIKNLPSFDDRKVSGETTIVRLKS